MLHVVIHPIERAHAGVSRAGAIARAWEAEVRIGADADSEHARSYMLLCPICQEKMPIGIFVRSRGTTRGPPSLLPPPGGRHGRRGRAVAASSGGRRRFARCRRG